MYFGIDEFRVIVIFSHTVEKYLYMTSLGRMYEYVYIEF